MMYEDVLSISLGSEYMRRAKVADTNRYIYIYMYYLIGIIGINMFYIALIHSHYIVIIHTTILLNDFSTLHYTLVTRTLVSHI